MKITPTLPFRGGGIKGEGAFSYQRSASPGGRNDNNFPSSGGRNDNNFPSPGGRNDNNFPSPGGRGSRGGGVPIPKKETFEKLPNCCHPGEGRGPEDLEKTGYRLSPA